MTLEQRKAFDHSDELMTYLNKPKSFISIYYNCFKKGVTTISSLVCHLKFYRKSQTLPNSMYLSTSHLLCLLKYDQHMSVPLLVSSLDFVIAHCGSVDAPLDEQVRWQARIIPNHIRSKNWLKLNLINDLFKRTDYIFF